VSDKENNLLEEKDKEMQTWTRSLEELGDIEGAFEDDKRNKLHGKTILDIGTDCVKPLYIALKYEPDKIIGIDLDLSYSFAGDLELSSKHFTNTEIKLYACNFFDEIDLRKILQKEKEDTFDFVLVIKTLHHFRTGKCISKERDQKHKCSEDEKNCIYQFEEQNFQRFTSIWKKSDNL